ncbi:MAG: DUF3788 domain-containing protein [Flavobacteriaceae bacterium]|nr:DUF3788 domain-containing protein [Flavobacteriaceae bacterium]
MSASLYDDKDITPNDKMLENDLEDANKYYEAICNFIKDGYGALKPEWKFYNKKSGWILKLFNKKRNVLFIIPLKGYFKVAFTFGQKTAYLVLNSELPEKIKNDLQLTKKYAEGRTFQINVKNKNDLENILKLISIKLST